MTDIAIQVENLSKRYRIGRQEERPETLVGAALGWLKAPVDNFRQLRQLSRFQENGQEPDDIIWPLKDVSFQVKRGEVVGIIGRNGAGKSTLLKILSRITEPTSGRVVLNGRVSSLLEVGTGFHPDLTGRENVYLNGAILGMTKREIDRKFDEIVDFSGVERFIDTPVKRYSSGMQVRLAFAVAAHLEPEILLVDEVLAVGDAAFQKKCLGKMGEVAKEGRTVLFVSHNMGAIARLCTFAILLIDGGLVEQGSPRGVIDTYIQKNVSDKPRREWRDIVGAPGDEYMRIIAVYIQNGQGQLVHAIDQDRPFFVTIVYRVLQSMPNANIGFELRTQEGIVVFSSFDSDNPLWAGRGRSPGMYTSTCLIPAHFLNEGDFYLALHAGIPFMRVCVAPLVVLKLRIFRATKEGPVARMGASRRGLTAPTLKWEIRRTEVSIEKETKGAYQPFDP